MPVCPSCNNAVHKLEDTGVCTQCVMQSMILDRACDTCGETIISYNRLAKTCVRCDYQRAILRGRVAFFGVAALAIAAGFAFFL